MASSVSCMIKNVVPKKKSNIEEKSGSVYGSSGEVRHSSIRDHYDFVAAKF